MKHQKLAGNVVFVLAWLAMAGLLLAGAPKNGSPHPEDFGLEAKIMGDPDTSTTVKVVGLWEVDDIQGWSWGLCHNPSEAMIGACAGMTLEEWHPGHCPNVELPEDFLTAGPGGMPPHFYSVNIYEGGIAQGVVLDLTLQIGLDRDRSPFDMLLVTYELLADEAALSFCESLGSPPLATKFVVGCDSISPALQEGVTLRNEEPEQCDLTLELGEPRIDPPDTAAVPVLLTTCRGQAVDAFQFGITFDRERLSVDITRGAATVDAQYFEFNLVRGGAIVGSAMAMQARPFVMLPPSTPDQEIAVAIFTPAASIQRDLEACVELSGELGYPLIEMGVSIDEDFVRPDAVGGPVCFRLTSPNQPPVADAGGPYHAECACAAGSGVRVRLDGRGSQDPDGDRLTYAWTGPFAESPAHGARPTVTLLDSCEGEVMVRLVVNDGRVDSRPDTAMIMVVDTMPPELICPEDQIVTAEPGAHGVPAGELDIPHEAADACAGMVPVVCDAPEFLPLGTTVVTCLAVDHAGNDAMCRFKVTVESPSEPRFIRGDFNVDGCVDVRDVRLSLIYVVRERSGMYDGGCRDCDRNCERDPRCRDTCREQDQAQEKCGHHNGRHGNCRRHCHCCCCCGGWSGWDALYPPCLDAADANDDGTIDIGDPICTLRALLCCDPLPAPFPWCGVDPTEDDLDCEFYPPCNGRGSRPGCGCNRSPW